MYDFHKSRHENNENEFRHKMFKRGQKHLLADIKRKTSEGHQYHQMHQIVPHKDLEIEKFKKDYNYFIQETLGMKNRQQELENFTKAIFNQNNRLIQENKLLWTELIKNKEKSERKIEKLMLFIFSLLHANPKTLGMFNGKKHLTNFGEISKIAGDPNAPDAKVDFSNFTSNGTMEQNAVSLLQDPKFQGPEGENLLKRITKMMHYGPNGEPEYASFEQFMEGFNKECEKNNKSYGNPMSGGEEIPVHSDYMPQQQGFMPHGGMDRKVGKRGIRSTKGRKLRGAPPLHDVISGSEEDYGGEVKKQPKLESSNANMMHIAPSLQADDYSIKNEVDHDFMSPNMMNSPVRGDYANLNISIPKKESFGGIKSEPYNMVQPIAPSLYNRNMIIPQIPEPLSAEYNYDQSQMKYDQNLMGGYQNKQSDMASNPSPNPYTNMKDFGDMLHDMYPKQPENKMNFSEKKNELDDSVIASSPLIKNTSAIGGEPFSPALYMNSQNVQPGMNYLHNIEDLVNERN